MIPVRSFYRVDPERGLVYGERGHPLGSLDGCGYLKVDGRSRGLGHFSAARLVWEAVHGEIPGGLEINHRNGVKTDNRVENLELVTRQENIKHAYATGLASNAGERHPRAKLTDEQVREIRSTYRRYSRDANARVIADRMGVSRKCVAQVAAGETWTEVLA